MCHAWIHHRRLLSVPPRLRLPISTSHHTSSRGMLPIPSSPRSGGFAKRSAISPQTTPRPFPSSSKVCVTYLPTWVQVMRYPLRATRLTFAPLGTIFPIISRLRKPP